MPLAATIPVLETTSSAQMGGIVSDAWIDMLVCTTWFIKVAITTPLVTLAGADVFESDSFCLIDSPIDATNALWELMIETAFNVMGPTCAPLKRLSWCSSLWRMSIKVGLRLGFQQCQIMLERMAHWYVRGVRWSPKLTSIVCWPFEALVCLDVLCDCFIEAL